MINVAKGKESQNFIGLVKGDTKVIGDLIVKDRTGDRLKSSEISSVGLSSSM